MYTREYSKILTEDVGKIMKNITEFLYLGSCKNNVYIAKQPIREEVV